MSTTRGWNAVLGALLSSLLLAGCAAPAEAPRSSAPSSPARVAETESPSPRPLAEGPPRLPAIEELVVTPAGIGSLVVGKPVSETDMVRFDPEHCADQFASSYPHVIVTDDPGKWVANYPYTDQGDHLFGVVIHNDTVLSIEIRDPRLRTSHGIGIGSSIDELVAAYPSLVPGAEGQYSESLVLVTAAGELVFEVMTRDLGGSEDRFASGKLVRMRIFPPGSANLAATVGSDDAYEFC